jgi:hypothetical protein
MTEDYLRTAAMLFVSVFRPAFQFWGYVMDELGEQL